MIYTNLNNGVIETQLERFGTVPIRHGTLLHVLAGFKRPNDKIADWARQGVLVPLKRGLYVVGESWRRKPLAMPLLANQLYGPSCVSLDYALAWHGLIPERVYELTSVCMRRSHVIDNVVGRFSYTKIPADLYPVGMMQVVEPDGVSFLMASAAKALCDKLLLTPNLDANSVESLRALLWDDWRLDPDLVSTIDMDVVHTYMQSGRKARMFKALQPILAGLGCR